MIDTIQICDDIARLGCLIDRISVLSDDIRNYCQKIHTADDIEGGWREVLQITTQGSYCAKVKSDITETLIDEAQTIAHTLVRAIREVTNKGD